MEENWIKDVKLNMSSKKYKEVVSICKGILIKDRSNIKAMSFMASALSKMNRLEESKNIYLKLHTLEPDDPKHWISIRSICLNNIKSMNADDRSKAVEEIINASKKLLFIYESQDPSKYIEETQERIRIFNEFQSSTPDRNDVAEIADLMLHRLTIKTSEDFKSTAMIRETAIFINYYLNLLGGDYDIRLSEALNSSVKTLDLASHDVEWIKIYIKILYRTRDNVNLLKMCDVAIGLFPDGLVPYEWTSKIYLESLITGETYEQFQNNPERYWNKLLSVKPDSTLGLCASGGHKLTSGEDFKEATRILESAVQSAKVLNTYAVILLARAQFRSLDFMSMEKTMDIVSRLLDKDKIKEKSRVSFIKTELATMRFKAYYTTFKIKEAYKVSSVLNCDSNDTLRTMYQNILAFQGFYEPNIKYPNKLAQGIQAFYEQAPEAEEILSEFADTSFEASILLGLIMKKSEQKEKSVLFFLKSAKLNPNNPRVFQELGIMYDSLGGKEKAIKCMEKSYQLNSNDEEVGSHLSDMYRSIGDFETNFKFLSKICSLDYNETSQWAFVRLGFHYLNINDPSKAIPLLQTATKVTTSSSVIALEALADAYLQRKSYTSALKTFEKVSYLKKEFSLYSEYQIAYIKYSIGQCDDSISTFEKIIALHPDHFPSFKGLAESYYSRASSYLIDVLDANAVQDVSAGLAYALRAAELQPGFGCLWKLAGDFCLLIKDVSNDIIALHLRLPDYLTGFSKTVSGLAILATKFYSRAIKLAPNNAGLWQDFGYGLYLGGQDISTAISAIKKAVSLEPGNYSYWNTLGVIAFEDPVLAQHSFIKSVSIQPNSIAWVNLGILYQIHGKIELAHKAFKESQNVEPEYVNGWSGQSSVSEIFRTPETMDLYRHSTLLGYEVESSIGFSEWIIKTMKEISLGKEVLHHNLFCIQNMHGVSSASDCLDRVLRRYPNDLICKNYYGVLLEKEGRLLSSLSAFETSSESIKNICRVLYKLGSYSEVIKRSNISEDLDSTLLLALAHYKLDNFKEANDLFRQALSLASKEEDKLEICVAISMVALKVQGPSACKAFLFQSLKRGSSVLAPLLALCVLGITTDDKTLISASFKELDKSDAWNSNVVALKAAVSSTIGQTDKARLLLCKALHRNPGSTDLWRILSLHLLKNEPKKMENSIKVSAKTSALSRGNKSSLDSCFEAYARGSGIEAIRAASKAVLKFPNSPETWCLLLGTMGQNSPIKYRVGLKSKVLAQNSPKLSKWIDTFLGS